MPVLRGPLVAMGFRRAGLGRAEFRRLDGVAGGLVGEWVREMGEAAEPALCHGRARWLGGELGGTGLVETRPGGGRRGKGAGAPECQEIFEGGEQGGELDVDQGEQDR